MELTQDRLDVRNKTRSNLFNWRGQFTPQFVDYILENFTRNGNIVIDPFSGSGTVLLECARRELACYGYEINPAAYAMSKFFSFCNIVRDVRTEVAFSFQHKINKLLIRYGSLPMFLEKDSFRESYGNLLDFSQELFSIMDDPSERILAVNTLFTAEDYKNGNMESCMFRAFKYIRDCLMQLPYADKPIVAGLGDVRLLHKNCPARANIIFTSPPYINVFNYHQNHRAILEVLGWDILEVAQSEIGSNRKNRGNRFKTVVQYCLDMELTLKSFWECLENEGFVVFVIGRESNVRKTPFYNGEMVKDIAQGMGGFKDIQNFTRTFINKFGVDIKEDIIVIKKSEEPPTLSKAREISLKHLESSLRFAPEVAKGDVLNTIASIDTIQPSPFFSVEGDFLNAKNTA
ncbi:MAG: hypothetical protein DDT32_00142 [Syntrophomonadaceae bacterium]|nr:hypothetical protein [Bacillota bacterium]MBT9146416.1 hypothetical protein [Bacillota bacterium]